MKLLNKTLLPALVAFSYAHDQDGDGVDDDHPIEIDDICAYMEDRGSCNAFGVGRDSEGNRTPGLCAWKSGTNECVPAPDNSDDSAYCSMMDYSRGKCKNDDRCAYDSATGNCIPADESTCRMNDGSNRNCSSDPIGCSVIGNLCCATADPSGSCPELADIDCTTQDDDACKSFSDGAVCVFRRITEFFGGSKTQSTECSDPDGSEVTAPATTSTSTPTAPPTPDPCDACENGFCTMVPMYWCTCELGWAGQNCDERDVQCSAAFSNLKYYIYGNPVIHARPALAIDGDDAQDWPQAEYQKTAVGTGAFVHFTVTFDAEVDLDYVLIWPFKWRNQCFVGMIVDNCEQVGDAYELSEAWLNANLNQPIRFDCDGAVSELNIYSNPSDLTCWIMMNEVEIFEVGGGENVCYN